MPTLCVHSHLVADRPPVPQSRRTRHRLLTAGLCALALAFGTHPAGAAETVRLAVLKYGTANWELDVIHRHHLDTAQDLALAVKEYAGPQATTVALQAGDTDLAIEDWIWVARQRTVGRPFTFVPYSTAPGALVAGKASGITGLAGLKGKRLGIAGGPTDKNWLTLRALAMKQQGSDLAGTVEPVYGAPPLVGEQLKEGRVDAVVTYWHYAARLGAAGYPSVLNIKEAQQGLGIETELPMIGYCFDETWAAGHRDALVRFFRATDQARALLRDSDAEWDALRPLMGAPDEATFVALRDGYRAGIPTRWGAAERAGAERLYEALRTVGGTDAVGVAERLPAGTFWDGVAD